MKKFTRFLVFAGLMFLFSSCIKVIGDGPVVTETRVVRDFSEIDFGVPGDMVFIESDDQEIEIEAQRNIIDVIETYVSGDELRIRVRDGKSIRTSEDIRITVRAKDVSSLALSGSGRLSADDLNAGHARVRVSGSGKIKVQHLQSEDLEARISGSGSIEVMEGSVEHEDLGISGSGSINLQPLVAKRASTQTSGSGNIRLHATDELDVRISGSGDVFYEGNPVINVSVSGSGRLIKL